MAGMLGQPLAVIETQIGTLPDWIHRQIVRRLRFPVEDIHRHMRIGNAKIRQQQANLIGISGREIIIEFHAGALNPAASKVYLTLPSLGTS